MIPWYWLFLAIVGGAAAMLAWVWWDVVGRNKK